MRYVTALSLWRRPCERHYSCVHLGKMGGRQEQLACAHETSTTRSQSCLYIQYGPLPAFQAAIRVPPPLSSLGRCVQRHMYSLMLQADHIHAIDCRLPSHKAYEQLGCITVVQAFVPWLLFHFVERYSLTFPTSFKYPALPQSLTPYCYAGEQVQSGISKVQSTLGI